MISIQFYTKSDCPLCEQALASLREELGDRPHHIETVDIETDPKLQEQFRYEIPVIRIDGTVRFRGKMNLVLLRRLLRGRDRQK
ncbi:MAG: glutaredoxin family protein [Planctomycetota bacterium]|jgi:glutaredoxin|nr:glutaredoxin family protein [Planctomycetota bacterium]